MLFGVEGSSWFLICPVMYRWQCSLRYIPGSLMLFSFLGSPRNLFNCLRMPACRFIVDRQVGGILWRGGLGLLLIVMFAAIIIQLRLKGIVFCFFMQIIVTFHYRGKNRGNTKLMLASVIIQLPFVRTCTIPSRIESSTVIPHYLDSLHFFNGTDLCVKLHVKKTPRPCILMKLISLVIAFYCSAILLVISFNDKVFNNSVFNSWMSIWFYWVADSTKYSH